MQNLSFEVQGATPGSAFGWTVTTQASVLEYAIYGDSTIESFETGWENSSYKRAFVLADLQLAQFSADVLTSPSIIEGFEIGWGNTVYYTESYPAVDGNGDDFETGWGNDDWTDVFTGGMLTIAMYQVPPGAPQNFEGFSAGWKGNQNYAWSMPATVSAVYNGVRATLVESFDYKAPAQIAAVNIANDWISAPGAGIANGYRIRFPVPAYGTIPSPIGGGALYYATSAGTFGADTFRVSGFAPGTPIIDITTIGAGYFEVEQPGEYWTKLAL